MSLFKTRELWSTSSDNELFDLGCLKVANLGINKKKLNSIITGSYNGFLRIYNPSPLTDVKSRSAADEQTSAYLAHDLVNETSFPSPILQIETGKFFSTSNKTLIAVLLPRKLAVYEAQDLDEGKIEHGNQYTLKFLYEHALERNAYNMCKGSFGGAQSASSSASLSAEPHEYICVQCMDGMLSIFEHESHSLSCFLPKVLLPGPLKYIPKTDSFVTVSAAWELECYKYQILATTAKTTSTERKSHAVASIDAATNTTKGSSAGSSNSNSSHSSNSEHSSKVRRVLPEHTFNLGEPVLDIQVVHQSSVFCSIVVMGERNLFCLSETCALRYMKKLDYAPSAFYAYSAVNSSTIRDVSGTLQIPVRFVVATHARLLYVHEDVRVKWAAQLDDVPVQLAVAKINELSGVIVTLSETGKLRCCYLGTEPAFSTGGLLEKQQQQQQQQQQQTSAAGGSFNQAACESEYRALQAQIKSAIMSTGSVLSSTMGARRSTGLIIEARVPTALDAPTAHQFGGRQLQLEQQQQQQQQGEMRGVDPLDPLPALTCTLTLRSLERAQAVRVCIVCAAPLVAVPSTLTYASLGSVPYEQEVCFYVRTSHAPVSLVVRVSATYTTTQENSSGPVRLAETSFTLPLKLVMKAATAASAAAALSSAAALAQDEPEAKRGNSADQKVKLTFETSVPCVQLSELFPEFAGSYVAGVGSGVNMIAACFCGQPQRGLVSIQGAKSGANRYRLQADNCESLWLIAHEFVTRLEAYAARHQQQQQKQQPLVIHYQDSLPADELRVAIDVHLELRLSLEHYKELLDQCSVQFRAIQKRILAKFKDKSPSPLDNMDALLEATHRQIVSIADKYLSAQRELSMRAAALNCVSSLYVLLVSLTYRLGNEVREILKQIMASPVGDTAELGWEETVNASVTNLIRSALSKSGSNKEAAALTQQASALNQLKLPTDSSKLDKQIKSLVSKLEAGAVLDLSAYKPKDAEEPLSSTTSDTAAAAAANRSTYTKVNLQASSAYSDNADNENGSERSVPQAKRTVELEPPKAKPPVVRNKFTMGEDYFAEMPTTAPQAAALTEPTASAKDPFINNNFDDDDDI